MYRFYNSLNNQLNFNAHTDKFYIISSICSNLFTCMYGVER